jgi:two-component system, NarL family, response regulator NreC
MKARILVVDDHPYVRKGVIYIVEQHEPAWQVIEACEGIEAIEKAGKYNPDLILMDQFMPKLDGVHAVFAIREKYPEIKIIMTSIEGSEKMIINELAIGVNGFITKNISDTALISVIKDVMNGKFHVTGRILALAKKVHLMKRRNKHKPFQLFTPRETQVLEMLCHGHRSRQIAEKLGISIRTVDFHRGNMLAKSGRKTSPGLIGFALDAKIFK